MNEGLRQALMDLLGGRYADGDVVTLTPRDERELGRVLDLFRQFNGAAHRDVWVSRAAFSAIGGFDVESATVQVGAGVPLATLASAAGSAGLDLGPLSPGAMALDVAGFLEGPYAGMRAVRGGRLEPVSLALTAMMHDGLIFNSHPSPRSAAGPDLDALFLGGEGRAGLLIGATLRLYPKPATSQVARFSFADLSHLLGALRGALAEGCWFSWAHLERRASRWMLAAQVIGSPDSVETDLGSLGREASERGGRSSGHDLVADAPGGERELSWDGLAAAIGSGAAVTLHRLSLESVIAHGVSAGEGLSLNQAEQWRLPAMSAAVAAADPRGLFGGAP